MNLRRLRAGEWLAGAGAVVLLAVMPLGWYDGRSAWAAFAVVDVILALVAVLALVTVALTATRRSPALPLAGDVVTALAGGLATLLVAIRLAAPPVDDADPRAPAVIGLVATAAILVGAWLAMRAEDPGPAFPSPPAPQARPAPPA